MNYIFPCLLSLTSLLTIIASEGYDVIFLWVNSLFTHKRHCVFVSFCFSYTFCFLSSQLCRVVIHPGLGWVCASELYWRLFCNPNGENDFCFQSGCSLSVALYFTHHNFIVAMDWKSEVLLYLPSDYESRCSISWRWVLKWPQTPQDWMFGFDQRW